MSQGLNKAMIIGHVGRDPEIRYTEGGSAIANLTVATSESWKDKHSGEKQEKTEWHRIVAFGNLAKTIEQYVSKGDQIYFEGKIQTRSWDDNDGITRYSTEIIAQRMQFLNSKGSKSESSQPDTDYTPPRKQQSSKPQSHDLQEDGFDDIPF